VLYSRILVSFLGYRGPEACFRFLHVLWYTFVAARHPLDLTRVADFSTNHVREHSHLHYVTDLAYSDSRFITLRDNTANRHSAEARTETFSSAAAKDFFLNH